MKNQTLQGRTSIIATYPADKLLRPNPILQFAPIWINEIKYQPQFGDRHSLLLLKRQMPKKVSFVRAYTGWHLSGRRELHELGEGRAFFRWLQKHELSIEWNERDFASHPYFLDPLAPKHEQDDELADGHSFVIRPVHVAGRNVKLYVKDNDLLSLLNLPYGQEEDFLTLVMSYITQRFEWEKWRAPAPPFLDWVVTHGKRPVFKPGQLGFQTNRFIYV